VVIIGDGAAGCATAYYLARAGVNAIVVEREGIAANASGYNAGGLNPLQGAGIPGPLASFALESLLRVVEPIPLR
jgi:glycine/D-amino acid oxidase-like deaminating enzyme